MSHIRPFRGTQPRVAQSAWVDPSAVVIGDVEIGPESSVWPMSVVRGDIHRIRIGRCSNIQDGSILHVTHDSQFNPGGHPLVIGDEVTVGHRVTLHGCEVGHRCLLGMGAVVMDGARLESELILAAGSLVPPGKLLQGGYLWRGSPARRVRELTLEERDYFTYVARHYRQLASEHRLTPD